MSNRVSESALHPFIPALVFIGMFVLLLFLLMPEPQVPSSTLATSAALSTSFAVVPTEILPTELAPSEQAPQEVVAVPDAAQITEGRGVFQSACSSCHGIDARGITGLGKDLVDSQFVHELTDDELHQFIIVGRDSFDPLNTTGIPMPPRGGNPSLTDEQLRAIVAYLRSESGSVVVAQVEPTSPLTEVSAASTVTPSAPLASPILPTAIPVTPQPFTVESAFAWSCAGCHGADGSGNPPFAEGFVNSPLLADRAALLSFIIAAHPPTDPQVEFPHPARGGYPELSDEQLDALIDYIMTLSAS